MARRWQAVSAVLDDWRIDDEWWRDREVSRWYYVCLLENGRRIVLFQDLTDGSWHSQAHA